MPTPGVRLLTCQVTDKSAVPTLSVWLASSYTAGPSLWSTGSTSSTIAVQSAGTYNVQAVDPVYGCVSTTASQTLSVGTADLSVTWQVSNRTPGVGTPVNYSLTVRNDGPCNVSNVAISNRLPPNVRFDSSPFFALVASTTDVLSGTIAAIAKNTVSNQIYTAHVITSGQYYNAIQIAGSSSPDPDSQPGSGTGDGQDDAAMSDMRTRDGGTGVFVSPNPNQVPLPGVVSNQPTPSPTLADLSLSIRSGSRVATIGKPVNYTLIVSNRGGATATNISVQDVLPAGLQFVSGSTSVSATSATVTASISQLAAGRDTSIFLTANVVSGTVIQNSAQIMAASPGDPDSTPGNGTTNGEDDTATTDLRVLNTGNGARLAAPNADADLPKTRVPLKRRTVRF